MPLSLRYGLAFVVPLAVTLYATPVAGRFAQRRGMVDHPKDGRFGRMPTPILGGLAIAVGLVGAGIAASGWEGQLLTILLCGIGIGTLGVVDDSRSVRPTVKIAFEAAAAVALWLAGVRAGLFGVELLDLALTIAWVVSITNAINLLDNMDGLSSGVVAIAALTFFAIAASRGDYLVGSFALVVGGSSIGFLRYNFPPASIYLGDAGSFMLGFLLSALALKLDLVGETGLMRSAVPALILGVPLFDTVLVVIARIGSHRPFYLGATDHSSHRLAHLGLSVRSVAVVTYVAQAICCALALVLVGASRATLVPAVIGLAAAATVALWAMLKLPHPHQKPVDAASEVVRPE